MRLYIIRHADPDYANDTITPVGHKEAAALSIRMEKQGLDRIYCSPLGRARATMQYTADRLNMNCTIEQWTQELPWRIERDEFPTSMTWDVHGEIIRQNNTIPNQDNWHASPPFDNDKYHEEFEKLKQNSDQFLSQLGYPRDRGRYRIEQPNRQQIAIFCHGGFGLTWLAHLLEIPLTIMWSGFFLPPTSVTTILFDERSTNWATPRCIGLADVSHLREANLPVTPSGIKANFY